MKQVPFLDVLNTRSDRLTTSVYRKSTFTGLLQNYNSFVPFTYKKGLIKSLIDRTFRLNNTWVGFHLDLEKLKVILQKNEYPPKLIDKSVYRYLSKRIKRLVLYLKEFKLFTVRSLSMLSGGSSRLY